MKKVAVAAVAVVLLGVSSASAERAGAQKPYVLTAIANIGAVYWRYDCVHYRQPEWSLGVHWNHRESATTGYTYRAGRLVRRGTLPAETVWFPFRKNGLQSLAFLQGTEAGILRARVTVDWRGDHGGDACWSYYPPRVSMELYPRR